MMAATKQEDSTLKTGKSKGASSSKRKTGLAAKAAKAGMTKTALKKAAAAKKQPSAPVKAASRKAAPPKPQMSEELKNLIGLITRTLDDDKAEDIMTIDMSGKSSIADAFIIASGRSQRHVSALAEKLTRKLKEEGLGNAETEGLRQGDWVLVDAGDVIVHIFRPEVRDFYRIEDMWRDPPKEA